MFYTQAGSGPDVLLLHGWGLSHAEFDPIVRDFQGAFRLTAVDFPGHGQSPEPDRPWDVTDYMQDTLALLDALGIAQADIVAHSFGGRVALLLASTHPERVRRLVLTGCAGLIPERSGGLRLKTRVYKALVALCDNALTRRALGDARIDAVRHRLQTRFGSADYRVLSPAMRATFSKVVNQDLRPCLPGVRASTLLFWGEIDTATPLWMGRVMASEIPDAGLVTVPGAGHYAFLEHYDQFRRVLRSFLGGAA